MLLLCRIESLLYCEIDVAHTDHLHMLSSHSLLINSAYANLYNSIYKALKVIYAVVDINKKIRICFISEITEMISRGNMQTVLFGAG